MAKFLIDIAVNPHFTGELMPQFSVAEGDKALQFHQRLPHYQATPLHSLDSLARTLGLAKVLVKDESYRFGLNAFKILGGIYAIAKLLCEELGLAIETVELDSLRRHIAQPLTFATATDGNHGRGVAWAAQQLGQRAVIYMPKGAAQQRVDNIRQLGAECIVTEMNYDDTVRHVVELAASNGWKVVQDTAWQGYVDIPTWIMQGYSTLASEVTQQLAEQQLPIPTHVILQAGVGAMAGGVLGYLAEAYGVEHLQAIIVEPHNADCIYRSGNNANGQAVNVTGELATMMAGLACGEPNPLSWPLLQHCARYFVSCEDTVAALGMRVLGNPLGHDARIVSGESGAVGLGLLAAIHYADNRAQLMSQLQLDADAVVLVISTEGDTDPVNYRDVVWLGKYAAV